MRGTIRYIVGAQGTLIWLHASAKMSRKAQLSSGRAALRAQILRGPRGTPTVCSRGMHLGAYIAESLPVKDCHMHFATDAVCGKGRLSKGDVRLLPESASLLHAACQMWPVRTHCV